MFVALDKIEGRRGTSTMARECGFPDQPMLDEMTQKALEVLEGYSQGFVVMVEAASIDKQTHNMDSERAILDVIEFDRAIAVALEFAARHPDTLVVQTADHECGGFAVIGTSLVTDVELARRGRSGGGTGQLRQGVVAECDDAGFPRYRLAADGYPETTNIDRRLLFGYAANADRFEDWRTNSLPLVDSQQPFAAQPPMVRFPSSPMLRDTAGGFLISGHMAAAVAAHTAADVPLCAAGRGAERFVGYMDNTEVFFHIMRAAMGAD
jgi:alkaline phosphatase